MNIIAFVLFFKRFLTRQFHQKVITGPSSENNWLFSSDIFPITFESKGISKSVAFGERPRWQKNKLSCYYYYIYLNKLTEVGGLVWSGLSANMTQSVTLLWSVGSVKVSGKSHQTAFVFQNEFNLSQYDTESKEIFQCSNRHSV